jgi:[calcium/calmodulin-dependent protein kinase] kinase
MNNIKINNNYGSNDNINSSQFNDRKSFGRPRSSSGIRMSIQSEIIPPKLKTHSYSNSCGILSSYTHKSPIFSRRKKTCYVEETYDVEKKIEKDRELINQYQVESIIGKGQQSIVKKVIDINDNKEYAMKVIKKKKFIKNIRSNENINDKIESEIAILHKITDFPHCVRLFEVLYNDINEEVMLILEYCSGGHLIDLNKKYKFDYEKTWRTFRQLIIAIEYLHSNDIIHLDIKPANILLDENNNVKITDFGVSQILTKGSDLIIKANGTPAFYSPELCHPKSKNIKGKPIDIWALGVTLYCMVYGKLPYSGPIVKMFIDIIHKPVEIKLLDNPLLENLLFRLLEKDPNKRITIDELKKHKWITNNGKFPLKSSGRKIFFSGMKNIIKPLKKK